MVNCSQKAAYVSRNRVSCAFSGVCSGDDSESSSIVWNALHARVGEVGSKGWAELKLPLVPEELSALIIVARLRLLRFFSLSSVSSASPVSEGRDSLLDAHRVICETVLVRRIAGEGVKDGRVVEKELELELELMDTLSSIRRWAMWGDSVYDIARDRKGEKSYSTCICG